MDRSRIDAHSQTGVEGGEMGPEPAQAKRGITSCSSDATQLGRIPLMLVPPSWPKGTHRAGAPFHFSVGFLRNSVGFMWAPARKCLILRTRSVWLP